MKLSMIVFFGFIFLHIFHNCENNLHYLQYIPEDEIGGIKDFICDLTHLTFK